MDTKLKKFNLSALFKLVAIALCLLCIGGTVTQLTSSLVMAEKRELGLKHFEDALYYADERDIWETESFKREYQIFGDRLSYMITAYGDGSEDAYNTMVESRENQAQEKFNRAKKNLIAQIKQDQGFFDYLVALSSGDIVECGFVEISDKLDSDNFFYAEEIDDADMDYDWLSSSNYSEERVIKEIPLTDEVRKLAEEKKADGIIYLSSEGYIINEAAEETEKFYPAGYYLFKVDDATLKTNLIQNNIIARGSQTFEQFSKEYEELQQYLDENFSSARYFIRDALGNTYTNVKSLGKKSDDEKIISAFSKMGFYTVEADNEGMLLHDGRYYTGYSFFSQLEGDVFAEGTVHHYNQIISPVQTTTMPVTTTFAQSTTVPEPASDTAETTAVTVTVPQTEPVHTTTVPATVPTAATTDKYNGTSSFLVLTEKASDMDIYVGVDMSSEAYANRECRFSQVNNKIILARDIAKDTVKTCGALVILFIALFIFLILYSGRRFGDKENVYMFRLDSMFTDWRIIIDCGIGFLLILLIGWILEEFFSSGNVNELVILASGAVCAAFGAVVLNLVLFITRHIKNKTLFKKLFLVWCIEKFSEKSGKALKIKNKILSILLILFVPVNIFAYFFIMDFCDDEIWMLLSLTALLTYDFTAIGLLVKEKNWIVPIKEKMKYVRGFEKETVIKGIIVLGVNAVLGLCAIIEIANTETLWFLFALMGFDIFVCIQLIRFIAGVKKIFTAVNELKEGNYDVQINLFAIPSSLREPANKLMSLRDGLKDAVDEAVKQEQTKTELITNVSHDLKTPLTSIINYVELLKKCDIADEDAKEYLAVLGEKSDRLKKLIEDLVEASKASTGNLKVEFMEVSLNEITSQIIGEFCDNFEEKGLSLVTVFPEENIIVKADSKMLYRVLENLMSNVSKYAMENTRVYITVEKREGRGAISVKNISALPLNITAEQLKARFVRGDEARTTDGSGLGLSIAESLCEIQGGRLNIEINGDLFVAEVEI